jgi:hypothetical protein
VLVHEINRRGWDLAECAALHHNACMALHDWASRDVEVAENLVQALGADELDGGIVHLPKKEGHGTAGP